MLTGLQGQRNDDRSWMLGVPLVVFLLIPVVALVLSSSPAELESALRHPMVRSAGWLSLQTTTLSVFIIVLSGTPLAWWLARSRSSWSRVVETLVELPIVLPPAVVGVALLAAYGRRGMLGGLLDDMGAALPFSVAAVVVAQIVVAAPFYVQSATAGFRRMDEDLLLVAKTLGATPLRAFLRVAIPAALPALAGGAGLSWARAVGEFGATLLFAGNLAGRTQTMPLAIYSALEADLGLARALALLLGAAAFGVLLMLRVVPSLWLRRRRRLQEDRS